MTVRTTLIATLRHSGPAMGQTARRELARATLGTALAIILCDLALWSLRHFTPTLPGGTGDPLHEVIIVAPFAATAFLILTVPNSPLAQPWSVIVGNALSALAGVICAALVPFPVLAAAAAVGISVLAMALARALHPPGAAMALNVVLLTYAGGDTGPVFLLATVTAGSVALVLFGMAFNTATGRRYPFRAATEAMPAEAVYLSGLLERLRLSANIGVGDLSRVIATVEAEATARHLGQKNATEMMTTDPLTFGPDVTLPEIMATFAERTHFAYPIVHEGRYMGLLTQTKLIDAPQDATAADLMQNVSTVMPEAELPDILPPLTSGGQRMLPVVQGDVLVGIITRADLINVLSRALRTAET